jgi:magnesium-transporting ATPase (P-type)
LRIAYFNNLIFTSWGIVSVILLFVCFFLTIYGHTKKTHTHTRATYGSTVMFLYYQNNCTNIVSLSSLTIKTNNKFKKCVYGLLFSSETCAQHEIDADCQVSSFTYMRITCKKKNQINIVYLQPVSTSK